ncbi:MAG: TonB-dependent receptor, partial [Acidobacteria bacterium]|nr:TonB-dependent receptor [Acidobacteriota bacterium]
MAKKMLGLIAVFFGFLLSSQVVLGQLTTATISGTVKDTSEAVLPGVAVSIRNTQTGITRTITTDGQGRYTATNLAVGDYEVQSELQGFQTTVRSGIELTVGREAVVHFVLEVGAVAERIVVQAEAPMVDTTTSTVGGLVGTQQIEDLPINARSYDKLARLETGVAFVKKAGSGSNAVGGRTEKMSIGGGRVTQNLFLMDGTDISDKTGASPGGASSAALGMEAIREFRVLTSTYGAQYGRAVGGIVEVVTKSGTNELHGSGFYYHRNDNMDARNFFDGNKKPEFKRNQFGGSVGGPILRDKSFFFGSYEGLRERLGVTQIATVPDLGARSGNLGTAGTVTVAEAVKPYLSLFPLPNRRLSFGNGTGEFLSVFGQPVREDYFLLRGDHNFNPNFYLMGRYNFDDSALNQPHNPPVSFAAAVMRRQTVTLESTQILSPTLLNKVRFGLNRSVSLDTNIPAIDIPSSLDWVPGRSLLTSGALVVRGMPQLGGQRFVPNGYSWTSFQYGDDVSYVRGRHSLKMGVGVQRIRYNHRGADAISGEYQFNSLSLFLRKQPAQFLVQSVGTRDRWLRQTLFGTYIQDDIQLLRNLALNLGLRWEFVTSPVEIFGQSANLVDILDTEIAVGNPFFETRKKNFSPRVGFAWDPMGKGTTSVRGGFGLFHDQPIPTYWYMVAQHNPPFVLRVDLRNNLNFPNDNVAAQGVTATDFRNLELRSFVFTGTGYAMQYNLSVQKQLPGDMVASVGYMGSQARKLIRRSQANTKFGQLDANGEKFFTPTEPRRNPSLGNVEQLKNDVNANYNALITSLRKRFAGGFQFQVSYTWAKA